MLQIGLLFLFLLFVLLLALELLFLSKSALDFNDKFHPVYVTQ